MQPHIYFYGYQSILSIKASVNVIHLMVIDSKFFFFLFYIDVCSHIEGLDLAIFS
jgi:hypothetical protein